MRWIPQAMLIRFLLRPTYQSRWCSMFGRLKSTARLTPTFNIHRSSLFGGSIVASLLVGLSASTLLSVDAAGLYSQAPVDERRLHEAAAHHRKGHLSTNDPTDLPYPRLLPKDKTRLLVLHPGHYNDELRGELKHIRSLEDHHYEALSYVWGSDPGGYCIHCVGFRLPDGMMVPITPNLDSALRRLRFEDRPRLLWVDAICINQQDIIERSNQIKEMREIYLNAKEVVIWLGEPQGSEPPFELLRQLRDRFFGARRPPASNKLGWFRDRSGRVFSGGDQSPIVTDEESRQLVDLLSREWFQRTWIIQEAASSKFARFYCGDQSLDWATFADVFKSLGDRLLPLQQPGTDIAQQALDIIVAIELAWRTHSGPLEMSLLHILLATSNSKCKDDRDKIFAVEGLAKEWRDKDVLHSDYRTPVKEVFTEFAVEDLIYYRNLRILSCVSEPSGKHSQHLPSWVPDWTSARNAHPFVRYSNRTRFSASGNVGAEAWHTDHRMKLIVTGKQIDFVSELAKVPQFSKTISVFEINEAKIKSLKGSRAWLLDCRRLAFEGLGTTLSPAKDKAQFDDRYNRFWRTMSCGLTGDGFPASTRFSDYFKNYLEWMESAPEQFENYMHEARNSPPAFRSVAENIRYSETHAIVEDSLDKWSSKRLFCKTKEGRLACVPPNAKPGDVICVLFGAEVPYVLRPKTDVEYEVVGECYVDGIMHGEGLSEDVKSREFHLV